MQASEKTNILATLAEVYIPLLHANRDPTMRLTTMDPESVPCRMCSWISFLLHSRQLVALPFYRGISSRVTHVEGSRQVELFPGFHKRIYKLRVRPLVDLGSSSHAIPFSN
jgi:hypothetical protein